MPGPPQHRTPYWYRHSYHQAPTNHLPPSSLQFFAPNHYVQQFHTCEPVPMPRLDNQPNFMRQRSNREMRPRPSSISDLQYSLESSPNSSVPSVNAKGCSSSGSNTDSGVGRTDSQSSSELTNLDQSGSSLPSVSGGDSSGASNSSPDQEFSGSQIPVWKRNGKFVTFFRSFMNNKSGVKDREKKKVFGVELTKHLSDTDDEVPQVLRSCSLFLEDNGIIDGIYRVSGISSNIQRIKHKFDSLQVPSFANDPSILHDIHCVASVLKLYFRDLPTPLVTYDLYPHLVIASKTQEHIRVEKYKEILQRLPQAHYRTMDWLMRHLYRMSLHGEKTGMTSKNLAIVWAPNLLRCDTSELDTADALQDVGLQAVIIEFLIRCAMSVFALTIPKSLQQQPPTSSSICVHHCCCHCASSSAAPKQEHAPQHTVTFAPNTSHTNQLKPAIKNTEVVNRSRTGALKPRPRSVALANPSTSTSFTLEEVKMLALPAKQTAELVDVSGLALAVLPPLSSLPGLSSAPGHVCTEGHFNEQNVDAPNLPSVPNGRATNGHTGPVTSTPVHATSATNGHGHATSGPGHATSMTNLPVSSSCSQGQCNVPTKPVQLDNGNAKGVTFHTVLDGPLKKQGMKPKKATTGWKNIFHLQQFNRTGSEFNRNNEGHRSMKKIDSDHLPENKPLKMRPRPKSELNLAYSVQDSTLMLTPLKNNEFQVTTTNQFSYLPYQQHLHNCNNNNNNNNNNNKQQPFVRTNKLRQNVNVRQNSTKCHTGQRPKSVDFEVLKSVENICRAQPIAYSAGPCNAGAKIITGNLQCTAGKLCPAGNAGNSGCETTGDRRQCGQVRASQRDRQKEAIVGEWQNMHATRV